MPTYIFNKEDFIKWIDKEVSDEQAIIFTNELIGQLSISKKSGIKITHQYSEEVFRDSGIGHIAFGKSHSLGMIITNKERLSQKATNALNNKNQ